MAYNKLNKYKYYKNVLEIVNKHYISGITTYAGIYREYVNPVYPMSYKAFMGIINYPNLGGNIVDEKRKLCEKKQNNQLDIFEQ